MALFVGRLPRDIRPRELEDLFHKYGRITRCDIKRGGYGFVEYEDPRDAEDAIKSCDGMRFLGERIVVEWARGAKRANSEECFKCGKSGHWARSCPMDGGRDRERRGYDRREREPRDRDYGRRDRSRSPMRRDRSPMRRASPPPPPRRDTSNDVSRSPRRSRSLR